MHRGSSKGGARARAPPETLPLSASPARVRVTVEVARAGRVVRRVFDVPPGTLVREAVRRVGHSPEGCAATIDDTPVPMDLPVERPVRIVVVPTFSGG